MLIPVTHENLRGRRWPYVTIAIIALNIVAFLGTHWRLEQEAHKLAEVRVHILLLAAMHPDVQMTPKVRQLVEGFQRSNPKLFEQMKSQYRRLEDAWDARMRMMEPEKANEEMASLAQQLEELQLDSVLERYAYSSAKPPPVSYVTANFLHGGWLHLIFNMWFLWLAGSVLEDVWGRAIYPMFYLVAGVSALVAQGAAFPGSFVPVIGASGAVAALMGAFLVRFAKTKIQLVWFLWFGFRPYIYRFHAPAYAALPLWAGMQLLYALLFGAMGGVAYWAHIGGFTFGVVIALVLRATGIEDKVDQAIEAKVGWTADPRIAKASELIAQNQPEAAIAELQQALKDKPDQIEAHELLLQAYWRKQDFEAHKQTLATLCRLHVGARDPEAAWQRYEEFLQAGGEKLPSDVWLDLCRYLDNQQNWECAAAEYEKLARAHPAERASIPALVSAARIHLKNLNHREEAARLYHQAEASPVPHLDWEATIRAGLKQAAADSPQPASPVGRV